MVRPVQRVTWPKLHPDTTVVVPVMNESANILPLIKRVSAAVSGHKTEVLFVDDSKNDDSVKMVMLARMVYRSRDFDIRIFHRTGSLNWGGLSGAVTDGLRMAKADQVIVMDGDLQHTPETIPAMIEAARNRGLDLVVASRYCKGGSAGGLDGSIRHLVSRGSTTLAKTLFPLRLRRVSDPMTGFFLINRSLIERGRMRPKGFKILLEILATHPKLSVGEVPLRFAERAAGESHGTLRQGLEFFSQLLSLRFGVAVRLFNKLPKFVQFGAVGGGVFVLGMAMLYGMVKLLDWSPLLANAIQLVFTFWLNYVLNRHVTWRDRVISRLAMYKFLMSRAATTVINYFLFAWLINLHTAFAFYGHPVSLAINYLEANVIALIAITALNYQISDRWAFAEPKVGLSRRQRAAFRRQTRERVARSGRPLGAIIGTLLLSVITLSIIFVPSAAVAVLLSAAGLALFLQSSIEVWRMVYAYREPEAVDRLRFPEISPDGMQEKFCTIVPARHEAEVLDATLLQLAKQTHPDVSIVTVICDDDYDTLRTAYAAAELEPRISVIEYPLKAGVKPSKPLQLNYVLEQTKDMGFTVIGVFDAEDHVQPELLAHIDAAFRDPEIGIVQGGVQLMNHDSSWYSLHNVLEYYRWFNSAMAFQSDRQFMPLGGNTIFVRSGLLAKTGGWPVTLTEDCSLGVLLSTRFRDLHAKTAVYYEPALATREETPDTLKALFKQRVRWNQGFFHEWRKGLWNELPGFGQRLLAGYVLLGPVLLAVIGMFLVASLVAALLLSAPVGLVMLMYLPLIPVSLLGVLNAVFLYDFGKAFERKVTFRQYVVLFVTQFLYQIVLNGAALWSVVRELRGDQSWYKTPHSNLHRKAVNGVSPVLPALTPAMAFATETVDVTAYEGESNE